jgi:hypothetical protein
MERVRMPRPVGAMQGVDLLRTDRVTSPMRRPVHVLTLFVCGVAVLLSGGVVPAFVVRASMAKEEARR